MAITRVVESELLDHLDARDPEARRSRRDLRIINALMGNQIWFRQQLRRHHALASGGVVEIGAGEGVLSAALKRRFPSTAWTCLDLQPRPGGLPGEISWVQGNLFEALPRIPASVLIGGMIAHHFTEEELRMLARHLITYRAVFLCEPFRSSISMTWARLMMPFVGRVTRHDMPASIRAGFQPRELAPMLGLGPDWEITESIDWRGSLRFAAIRQ